MGNTGTRTVPYRTRRSQTGRQHGPRDITEDHIARLEKWVQVLDGIIEDALPDQDHVNHGDRGATTDADR